jgi:hypothetical protein
MHTRFVAAFAAITVLPTFAFAEGAEEEASGPGVVRLHVQAGDARVEVVEMTNRMTGTLNGRPFELATKRRVCVAPCDAIIDGRAGNPFFLEGDVPGAGPFTLTDRSGPQTLEVRPGSYRVQAAGIGLLALGPMAMVAGGIVAMFGPATKHEPAPAQAPSSEDAMYVSGAVVGGAGVAMLVTGIALLATHGTRFHFTTPARAGAVTWDAQRPLALRF